MDKGWKLEGVGEGDERTLLEQFSSVTTVFQSLPAGSQEVCSCAACFFEVFDAVSAGAASICNMSYFVVTVLELRVKRRNHAVHPSKLLVAW